MLPLLVGAIAALTVACAAGHLSLLFAHVSFDYGEGWNAYWAQAAMRSPSALYPGPAAMVSNNYPPLSFYLVGLVARLTGDAVVAGRLVALAAATGCAVLAAAIVGRVSGSAVSALFAGLLVALYGVTALAGYFAVNNPQWLGQFFVLCALLPLLQPTPGRRAFGAASLLAVLAAVLVKHNLLALPLAVFLWLWRRDRRAALGWVGWGLLLAAVAALVLHALFGGAVFGAVLGYRRTVDPANLVEALALAVLLLPVLAVGHCLAERGNPRHALLEHYALTALVLGTLQHLGAGVGANSHTEAVLGAIMLACAAVGTASARRWPRLGVAERNGLFALVALPAVLVVPVALSRSMAMAAAPADTRRPWERMIADVREARGPVLCEDLAVCFWAGKPMGVDFFSYGQKLRTGADPTRLLGLLSGQRPAMLILEQPHQGVLVQPRLPEPFARVIARNYRPVRSAGTMDEWRPLIRGAPDSAGA